jgi:alpha-tubulin suppressor-like RCC1 family protein
MGIKNNGTLWAWGLNTASQCGIPSESTKIYVPMQVIIDNATYPDAKNDDWAYVACCENVTIGLKEDGSVWTWGFGRYGETCNGLHGVTNYVDSPYKTNITVTGQ